MSVIFSLIPLRCSHVLFWVFSGFWTFMLWILCIGLINSSSFLNTLCFLCLAFGSRTKFKTQTIFLCCFKFGQSLTTTKLFQKLHNIEKHMLSLFLCSAHICILHSAFDILWILLAEVNKSCVPELTEEPFPTEHGFPLLQRSEKGLSIVQSGLESAAPWCMSTLLQDWTLQPCLRWCTGTLDENVHTLICERLQ